MLLSVYFCAFRKWFFTGVSAPSPTLSPSNVCVLCLRAAMIAIVYIEHLSRPLYPLFTREVLKTCPLKTTPVQKLCIKAGRRQVQTEVKPVEYWFSLPNILKSFTPPKKQFKTIKAPSSLGPQPTKPQESCSVLNDSRRPPQTSTQRNLRTVPPMKHYLQVALVLMAAMTQVMGLNCNTGCASCSNNSGVTKFSCSDCGTTCPSGYNNLQCVSGSQCQ